MGIFSSGRSQKSSSTKSSSSSVSSSASESTPSRVLTRQQKKRQQQEKKQQKKLEEEEALVAVDIQDMDICSNTIRISNSLNSGHGGGSIRRRRSIGGIRDMLYNLESSSDEEAVDTNKKASGSSANSGTGNKPRRISITGAVSDADSNGFPSIDGYTVLSRIGE